MKTTEQLTKYSIEWFDAFEREQLDWQIEIAKKYDLTVDELKEIASRKYPIN